MAIGDTYYNTGDFPWEEADGDGGLVDYLADLAVEGNVGIGTTNTLAILDINGTGPANSYALMRLARGGLEKTMWIRALDNSHIDLVSSGQLRLAALGSETYNDPATKTGLTVDTTGFVGFGTTNPGAQIDIKGPNGGGVRIGEIIGNDYGAIGLVNSILSSNYNLTSSPTDTNLYINRPSGKDIIFREANSDTGGVIIKSGGNVGIGTTGPSQKMQISSGASSSEALGLNVLASDLIPYIRLYPSRDLYFLDTNGNWTNTVRAGTFVNMSDLRLKTNISQLDNKEALDGVLQLVPVNYDLKAANPFAGSRGRSIGFIAQDVQKVFPELVSSDDKGMLGLDYPRITTVLTAAVQEQQNQIDALNQKIAALEAQLNPKK